MIRTRHIRHAFPSRSTLEGAGVRLHRAIGFGEPEEYNPFLLLDDFRADSPVQYQAGFPWHPHRGMETITYVLRGRVEHQDSLGNHDVIGPGDAQWMSAGSGIIHQEMPMGDATGAMYGFQLWANLPSESKMMEPRYRAIIAADVPTVTLPGGATVRVIAGTVGGVTGPVRDVAIRPEYLDVTVSPRGSFVHATLHGHTVFAYVIGGEGYFDPNRERMIGDRHLVSFSDGDQVSISTKDEPVRFLLVSGEPIAEPIAWQGPIVMNTEEELRIAFEEIEQGTFIKTAAALSDR
jgi:quercetin 2,3-dioxygenase